MRAALLILALALLAVFVATLALWASVEFRWQGGILVKEVFWLHALVGLPAGIASVLLLWRWLRARHSLGPP